MTYYLAELAGELVVIDMAAVSQEKIDELLSAKRVKKVKIYNAKGDDAVF